MKLKNILIVAGVVLIFIIAGVVAAVIGADNGGLNFVRLEINPKFEFIIQKGKVTTYRAVNEEAEVLLSGEDFMGLDFKQATTKYLDLCKQLGYLKVDGLDNTLKISCISGILQQDDVKVFRAASKFFVTNEIMAVIVENDDDQQMIKQAKKNMTSTDKELLINSILEMYPNKNEKQLRKMTTKKLLKLAKSGMTPSDTDENKLKIKQELINKNINVIKQHDSQITKQSTRKFADKYAKFYKQNKTMYERDYATYYDKWKQRHSFE